MKIVQAEPLGPHACLLQRRTVHVHTDDLAFRTNNFRQQEGDVTNAAAHVENTHTGADAGLAEKALGQGAQEIRLLGQAPVFPIRAAKGIGWIVHGCPR